MGFQSRSAAAAVGTTPVGHIGYFGNGVVPNSYIACDGAAVSRVTYATLFNAIGTAFGVGDGSTTFNLPDMQGRVPVGDGTGSGLTARTRGQIFGTETHPLTIAELASHDHGGATGSHSHEENPNVWMNAPNTVGGNHFIIRDASGAFMTVESVGGGSRAAQSTDGATASIPSQGSSTAHPNTQPSTVAKFAIKYIDSGVYLPSPPTIQKFLSGSGTYVTPLGCRYIRVRMVGGGGGGGGSGTSGWGNGGTGGTTSFGPLTANGGIGGKYASLDNLGGAGGTASLGSGPVGSAFSGSYGGIASARLEPYPEGGHGANSIFGGGGSGAVNGGGANAIANTGSGGGGASTNGTGTAQLAGHGGGSGGWCDAWIHSPAASYSYGVGGGGASGAAGVSGGTGGAGALGYIEVTEFY